MQVLKWQNRTTGLRGPFSIVLEQWLKWAPAGRSRSFAPEAEGAGGQSAVGRWPADSRCAFSKFLTFW